MPFNRLQDLSDSEFESKVVHSARVVIIDFWAPWCEPCKLLDPILERLAARFEGSVDFLKMNVDEEPETPAEFAVRSIPTMLFF
jgi:thioredoxin